MSVELHKYGTQVTIYFPLVKAGSQNFAVSGDYTHSSGDVKISKDGGAAATATNAPSAITMGNGAIWSLTLTATEMQAAEVVVTVIDAATKAVEDQCIKLHTFGNASAKILADLSAALATPTNITAAAGCAVSSIGNNVITAASIADGAIDAATFAAGAINAAAIASDAITDAKVASDVTIASVTGSVGSVAGNVGGNVAGSVGSVTGAVGSVTGDIGGKVLAGGNGTILGIGVWALDSNGAALATAANLATVAGYLDTEVAAILAAVDTEVAAIKAKTDSLTFTVAGQVDANIQYVNDVQIGGVGTTGSPWGPA